MKNIIPSEKNIDNLFSNTFYYIDFYQREYKWNKDLIEVLLNDIFFVFNQKYDSEKDISVEIIERDYNWYFLDTYISNLDESKNKLYLVDGQQRLTSISIILLALYQISKLYITKPNLTEILKNKIIRETLSGENFFIAGDSSNRKNILDKLYNEKDILECDIKDITSRNINYNYQHVLQYLKKQLNNKDIFEAFVYYFFKKIILIEIQVPQVNTPMVFEVINDRGLNLEPYEILKGKLLSKIDKSEVFTYSETWDKQLEKFNYFTKNSKTEFDSIINGFFSKFCKAKYLKGISESTKFDKDYHKSMIESNKNLQESRYLKNFINNDFVYFTNLFYDILNMENIYNENQPYIYYNKLTEMLSQEILLLAGVNHNDAEKDKKLYKISKLIDRNYVLLNLNGSYDSNTFNKSVYIILNDLKNESIEKYDEVFENELLKIINEAKGTTLLSPFNLNYFKESDYSYKFKKYFLARINNYLEFKINSIDTGSNKILSNIIKKDQRSKDFYEIEHVLSRNDENFSYFEDEEEFNKERNKLGGLLLLKKRENGSSSNELYIDKLKTYSNSNFIWNKTLTSDFYHKTNKNFSDFLKENNLKFQEEKKFDKEALNRRTELLFELAKLIWK